MSDMPKAQKEAKDLHEAYFKRFGHWAPGFGIPPGDILEQIRQALKTGKPIRTDIPPDARA